MLKNKKTYLIPIVGFLLIILVASFILYLPICNYKYISFKDSLFITISGLTTTGFTKMPLVSQFNFLGQLILAILMEVGALGFIIFISYFWSIRNKKMRMSDIIVINDNISSDSYGLIKEHSIFIGKFMLKVQIIGSILLSIKFIPMFGILKGIWYGIFHTISAFSNTGFDLIGANSFIVFSNDIYIQLVMIGIMFIGNIGVLVVEDIKNNKFGKFDRLKLQTKIVLILSAVLIFVPMILMKILEPNLSLLNCLFMSMTTRSTGFSVTNVSTMTFESKIILTILMFIGGGPTSTTGGVKMIPIAIIFATILSTLKGNNDTVIFWKKIPDLIVKRAFTILMVCMLMIIVTSLIFYHFDNRSVLDVVLENVSAFSNTGLSVVDYNNISLGAEILIMALMFIGRVGPLSVILVIINEDKNNKYVEYPTENVIL